MPSPGGSEPGATPYAPSWPRKPHTKTRSGCTICKRRKIKCDEQKPSCANCIKHGVHCNYAPWTARRWHGTASGRSPEPHRATTPSNDLSRHNSPSGNVLMFNETHLELLHHFTTVTYNTLTAHPTLKVMWRITVPQLGLKHPFLMRSLFAIAALNLALLRPQRRSFYVGVSREEHSAALAMAVPLISNATEDNASALFAFSMLAVIYILAAPREPGDHWLLVPEGGLTDWLALVQGTRSVSSSYQEHLSKGPVSPLFTVSHALVTNAEEKGQSHPAWKGSSEYRQMALLRQLIRERVDNAQRLSQYETLLDLLEQSFAANMVSPTSYCQETLSDNHEQVATSHIFSFLYRSLEIMQGPLQTREPEALVIFAHYCVLLHKLECYWWIQTLPRDIMEEIWGALNYEYRCWIQWPAEQLGWAPRDP